MYNLRNEKVLLRHITFIIIFKIQGDAIFNIDISSTIIDISDRHCSTCNCSLSKPAK